MFDPQKCSSVDLRPDDSNTSQNKVTTSLKILSLNRQTTNSELAPGLRSKPVESPCLNLSSVSQPLEEFNPSSNRSTLRAVQLQGNRVWTVSEQGRLCAAGHFMLLIFVWNSCHAQNIWPTRLGERCCLPVSSVDTCRSEHYGCFTQKGLWGGLLRGKTRSDPQTHSESVKLMGTAETLHQEPVLWNCEEPTSLQGADGSFPIKTHQLHQFNSSCTITSSLSMTQWGCGDQSRMCGNVTQHEETASTWTLHTLQSWKIQELQINSRP